MVQNYEQGTIKIVWLESSPNRLYSRMFSDLIEAQNFAQNKTDFLIFSLVKQNNMKEFVWELLPFGRHTVYQKLFSMYKNYQPNFFKLIISAL